MMQDNPEEFFRRNGLPLKRRGNEGVSDCHVCGKPDHLYVNLKTFVWHCKRCDERGNEYQLKRALGLQYDVRDSNGADPETVAVERMTRELTSTTAATDVERWTTALVESKFAAIARRYLESRKIPLSIAERYRLGWSSSPDGTIATEARPRRRILGTESDPEPEIGPGWLVIPTFSGWSKDGRPDPNSVSCVKLRSIPPAEKTFRRIAGGESALFAPNGIDSTTTLLVVGGELDAISVVVAGFGNVISTTTGETGWSDSWNVRLESCDDIVIIYDSDEAGRKGATALSEKLGAHRVRVGSWPIGYKDANEALQGLQDRFDVRSCIEQAKAAGGDAVVRIESLRERYKSDLRNTNPRGISTGWTDLDSVLGGVRDGEITLVTGDTSSGKSTFASQWALQMATQGVRSLVCPFEMGASRQLDKWVRQWSQSAPDKLTDSALDIALDQLQGLPIWMLNRYGTIRLEPMRNTLLFAIRRLGVRFMLIDHLHFMIEEGPNERTELDSMMKMLAEVAVDTKTHVVVVAHPRQHHASDEKHKDNRIIQMSDLKGSSGLKQMADNILSVWRPRKADRTGVVSSGFGVANVYALKARSDFAVEGSVGFKFVVESARYEPPDAGTIQAFQSALGGSESETVEVPRTRRKSAIEPERPRAEPAPKHWTEFNDDENI